MILIGLSAVLEMVAQQTILAESADQVNLTADQYRGAIQWETSTDNTNWTEISGATTSPFQTSISTFPVYFRARIEEEGCDSHYSEVIEVVQGSNVKLWSDPATWPNGKPQAGDEVTIPDGEYILLDESPPSLEGLTIHGVLEFDDQDLELTSKWIMVMGTLRIGYENDLHTNQATITLNDTDENANDSNMGMGTRALLVIGGRLELHGESPEVLWSKINAHANQGATSIELIENVDWEADDEIIIAPTDYYLAGFGASETQKVDIVSLDGNQLTISDGLNAHRWGLLQYPTPSGLSLTDENIVDPPVPLSEANTPLVLDERAEVANLSRTIVIQAPDDAAWANGFGVHTMIMPGSVAHVEGVEIRRAGQRARVRRYPWHWHNLSYQGTETLADATGQYLRNSAINSSANRGIVIHGTNGVTVKDNIVFDVRGHGIFLEDAVERRNIIDGNLVMRVRNPEWGDQLQVHESGDKGSSGFWISNPDNTVINNHAIDSQTFGFWLAFPERPFGSNSTVLAEDGILLRPNRLLFGVFDNNTAHSNRNDGLHLDDPQVDDEGNLPFTGIQYWSTIDGRTDIGGDYSNIRRFALTRFKTWKNMDNGSWDRGILTDMFEFVSADNCGRFFAGSGAEGVIERGLIVGTSLNFMMNGTGRPATADFQFYVSSAPTAFATYHSAFSMRENVVLNFEVTEYDRAGVFATDDYYFRPVEHGQIRNYDNLLINSSPGVKLVPPHGATYYTFASALWDPFGHWGPKENYLVYNRPFLTYGKDITVPSLGTDVVGGVSVPGPFYGFLGFVLHGKGWTLPNTMPFQDIMAIRVDRLDPNDLSSVIDTWEVAAADLSWTLQHMRDFATSPDGIYELTFPGEALPNDFHMEVENMKEETDLQVIGIQFDGSIDPEVFLAQVTDESNWTAYSSVNSLQEVINSAGETFWQDKPNDRIWVKIKGGHWEPTPEEAGQFEEETNETMNLRIRAAGQ